MYKFTSGATPLKCPNICVYTYIHCVQILCSMMTSYHIYTQADLASRDANIRRLEERCAWLEAQVSFPSFITQEKVRSNTVSSNKENWAVF